MTPGRSVRHLALLLGTGVIIAAGLIACAGERNNPMAPSAAMRNVGDGGGGASDTTSDNCTPNPFDDFMANSCHEGEIEFGDENYDCPGGCYSYPLTNALKNEISQSWAYMRDDGLCGEVKSYMKQMVLNMRVRYVHDDLFGDTHNEYPPGQGPNWQGEIHFDEANAENYGVAELADTLIHEGFHGYINENVADDEQDATAFAKECVP